MKQTEYGYVSREEQQIDQQLERELKQRLRKEGAFTLDKEEQE